ncbi:MAG: hypothetical protein VW349_03070, partial [Gammaproteobacteria bacterium]
KLASKKLTRKKLTSKKLTIKGGQKKLAGKKQVRKNLPRGQHAGWERRGSNPSIRFYGCRAGDLRNE